MNGVAHERRRGWLAALALVVLTSVLIVGALKLPLSRLDVPYTFEGDAVDKLTQIQNVAETGWLFHNPRLGYPFGYDRLDFPRFDSLNYAIMGPVAALTGKPGLAMNLYFIASFYLIGLIALFALRRLGLATAPALLCALVYAFLPYHLFRGVGHLTNGTYYLVPLAILAVMWLARGELDPASPGARRRWWMALATALLLPLQMPYNGVFFALLCVAAALLALARQPRWRSTWPALVLLAATSCSFVAEQAPALLHKAEVGANLNVATRSSQEAELYSMRLNQVLLPFDGHRLTTLSAAKQDFDDALDVPDAEFRNQYIGVIGVLGLLALLWSLARAATERAPSPSDQERYVRIAALLAIAILLMALSSGLFTLLAHWVTSKIRAGNRILPFFAFLCLFGSGWLLQGALARIRSTVGRCATLAGVGALALLDVTMPIMSFGRDVMIVNFDDSQAYFTQVEQRLGRDAAVFQLPVVWYPEHVPIGDMGDYEEFKPYLFTDSLKFSYGAAHGRPGYAWGSTIENLPAADMIAQAHGVGFSAILVDTNAYAGEQRKALIDALGAALPEPPSISASRRWWLFPLQGCCASADNATAHATAESAFAYDPDGSPISFGKGGRGGIYRAGGWDALEDWGVWSLGDQAQLRMYLQPRPAGPLELTLDARVLLGPKVPVRRVVMKANGHLLGVRTFTLGAPSPSLRFSIPQDWIGDDGLFELHFDVDPVASPRTAGVNIDGRPLGVGIVSLTLGTAKPAPASP
ncbi:hypothetical protein [Dokdonella sp.]|uniref:hypothetical protein n=1 Tax=Dokdonella sp. TaxID=2291710 RepID=UPI001AFF3CBB|nr:hypothetical protein [Dokdonella sp.]MBO9665167.1 hypothetical protein [Dokdonella sp.]